MKFKIADIYETAPIKEGDKIHTKKREELTEFYTDEELDKTADKDFIVEATSNGTYSVNDLIVCLIDDDIEYTEREV